MPITFPGNPLNYPANVRSLQDGEHVNEAKVGVTASDAADRTAYLKSFSDPLVAEQLAWPLQNFVKVPLASGLLPKVAIWDGLGRCYVGVGNSGVPEIYFSSSHGQSDAALAPLTITGGVSGEDPIAAAADPAGNLVFAGRSSTVFSIAGGATPNVAPVATRVTAIHADGAREDPGLAYDPVRAKYMYIADANGGGGGAAIQTIRISSDRVTWTTPAGTTGSAGGDTLQQLRANPGTGRLVYVAKKESATVVRVRTTDDCGTTWDVRADVAYSLTSPTYIGLTWSEEYAKFFMVIAKTTQTEVWTSTDGVAWTRICQLASFGLRRLESYGKALIAQMATMNDHVGHAISLDAGVTWKVGAFVPRGLARDLYRTKHGIVSLVTGIGVVVPSVYFSHVAGPAAASNTLT